MKYRVVQRGRDRAYGYTIIQECIYCSSLDEAQVCACMLVPLTLKEVQAKCETSREPIYKSHLFEYNIDKDTTIYECEDEG